MFATDRQIVVRCRRFKDCSEGDGQGQGEECSDSLAGGRRDW